MSPPSPSCPSSSRAPSLAIRQLSKGLSRPPALIMGLPCCDGRGLVGAHSLAAVLMAPAAGVLAARYAPGRIQASPKYVFSLLSSDSGCWWTWRRVLAIHVAVPVLVNGGWLWIWLEASRQHASCFLDSIDRSDIRGLAPRPVGWGDRRIRWANSCVRLLDHHAECSAPLPLCVFAESKFPRSW
jgi:hypothetical protein